MNGTSIRREGKPSLGNWVLEQWEAGGGGKRAVCFSISSCCDLLHLGFRRELKKMEQGHSTGVIRFDCLTVSEILIMISGKIPVFLHNSLIGRFSSCRRKILVADRIRTASFKLSFSLPLLFKPSSLQLLNRQAVWELQFAFVYLLRMASRQQLFRAVSRHLLVHRVFVWRGLHSVTF